MKRYTLHNGDNREVLKTFEDNSIDSIVCDPPYELGFMGKRWDSTGIAYDVTLWTECLRVLKPGGHLLAFGGSRTYHRLAVAIEDAGFEIRDCIMWLYGCLDEQTRIVTRHGVKQYNRIKVGDTVLCYNIDKSQYQYEQVQEVVVYDYHDTAYRLIGDFGEQVVSRNHRVIVERNGSEVFIPAEALQSEERIPILENMRSMQSSISDTQSHTTFAQSNMLKKLRKSKSVIQSHWPKEGYICQSCGAVRSLRQNIDALSIAHIQVQDDGVQSSMQWKIASNGIGKAFSQSESALVAGSGATLAQSHERRSQSSVEGWRDVSQTQGVICESANQVRALSSGVFVNGTLGRVCDGTSNCGCTNNRATIESHRSGASHQSRRNGQQHQQSDAVCEQCRTQNIRTSQIHKTTMVRVVPFTYTGKVWCVRVPSGAFVAERNGAYFPTGNSGFPKSHDVSKALDKQAGAEREVMGVAGKSGSKRNSMAGDFAGGKYMTTAPATPLAQQWQGWGTALKPSVEPIVVARKPLQGTVADNVTAWGVGGINIDGCRIPSDDGFEKAWNKPVRTNISNGSAAFGTGKSSITGTHAVDISANKPIGGRWPANIILDEGAAQMLDEQSGERKSGGENGTRKRLNSPGWGMNAQIITNGRPPDSGGASRFFFNVKNEYTCPLCYNTYVKDMTTEELCESISVSSAENRGWTTLETTEFIAHVNALLSQNAQLVQNAKSAIPLCGLCAISIAVVLAETKTWGFSHQKCERILDYMPKYASSILTQSLASFAELWVNTDITPTTQSLMMLYGYALHATENYIKQESKVRVEDGNGQDRATRFLYNPKASKAEREAGLDAPDGQRANIHTTVKPIALMRYLVRMVTPRDGVVLDPFMGSGTTGCAAMLEGVRFIGIELNEEYSNIAERRIRYWMSQNMMGI